MVKFPLRIFESIYTLTGKGYTPVFWPGEFHGLYSSWGGKELDRTERLSLSLSFFTYFDKWCRFFWNHHGHGTTDWFQIGKGVRQGCLLSPYLFNLYAEYIMRNAGLDEAQAGIKMARRNINNLRYADDTTLMAEREELKST